MNRSPLAIPYAKALFDLAKDSNLLEEILNDMKVVAELCNNSRDFRQLLKNPIIRVDKKQAIFKKVFSEVLSKMTYTYFLIIIGKKRENIIHDIADVFIELYKDYKGILTVKLKTAIPATDSIREQVTEVMKEQSKGEIEIIEEVTQELIGGFVLQWKDKQYDASISNQINRMQKGVARINLYVREL